MVDNFEKIKEYILKTNPTFGQTKKADYRDAYYTIEIIRRGKDNPNLPASNYHFKNYYITDISQLDSRKNEIIALCDLINARAYFAVNKKSFEQITKNTVAELAHRVATGDYKKPYNVYESCSGKYFSESDKKWVIDVDIEDAEEYGNTVEEIAGFYKQFIENDCKPNKEIICTIPTRSGLHIITYPFDVAKFNEKLREYKMKPHSDTAHQIIKKNHLTLLYYKDKD